MEKILLCTIFTIILFVSRANPCLTAFSDVYKSLDLLSKTQIEKSNLNSLSQIFAQLRYSAQAIESECIDDSVEVFHITQELYPDCETTLSLLEDVAEEYNTDAQKGKISPSEAITRLGEVLAIIPKIEKSCGLSSAYAMRNEPEEASSNNQENFINRVHRQENVEEEFEFEMDAEDEEEMKREEAETFDNGTRELQQESVLIID